MTSIERLLCNEFTNRGFSFDMHKTMFNRWQPDFVFEEARLIVQADGEYWHSIPRTMEIDRQFNEAALKAGWTVIRFTGSRIKADPSACADEVELAINP